MTDTPDQPRKIDLRPFIEEVEGGLKNESKYLDEAEKRQAFYDYDGFRYEADFKRDAESSFDYQGRTHRPSGFLRECVEILTEHLYCPGPTRHWDDAAGDELLQRAWQDNLADYMWAEADRLSTLNDVAAIQVDVGQGVYADRPVTWRLWGREQFHAWMDPNDNRCPIVVVTIDKVDLQRRYRLWTDTEVLTFVTKKAEGWRAGRVAELQSREPHTYGCIPFTFVHYTAPIRDFYTSSIGDLLHKAEVRIDDRLSRLDEAIHKHLNPIPVAEGVPAEWKPVIEPARFIRMPLSAPMIGVSGGYERGEYAKLYFLQPTVDSEGAWSDLLKYINQALEAARVPATAVRMEQSGVASGISLIVEQAPLLTRARQRRGVFQPFECDLARRTLVCCGNHYGKPALVRSAKKGTLILGWPQPSVPLPTPDRLELIKGEMEAGFRSYLSALQQWYGIDREDAIALAKQIEADAKELATVAPSLVAEAKEDEEGGEPEQPGENKGTED